MLAAILQASSLQGTFLPTEPRLVDGIRASSNRLLKIKSLSPISPTLTVAFTKGAIEKAKSSIDMFLIPLELIISFIKGEVISLKPRFKYNLFS